MVHKVPEYEKLAKDFASSLSLKSLVISIIEQIISCHIGTNDKGEFSFLKFSDDEIVDSSITKKIVAGVVLWFVEQASIYKKTGKFIDEQNDIIKAKKYLEDIKELIKSLANSKLYKENGFDGTEIKKELVKLINKTEDDETKDILELLAIQSIPVLFNRCMVRSYLLVKMVIGQIKEKNIDCIEGLKYLDFNLKNEKYSRVLARMNSVSTGIFAAVDATTAVVPAVMKGLKDAQKVAAITPGDDNLKALAGVIAGVKGGACEFASRINIANMVNLVTVIKVDWNYIIEDLKNHPTRFNVSDFVHTEYDIVSEIQRLTTLNKLETKILYSLEYHLTKWDISNTKDNNTQIRKDEWLSLWMQKSEEATDINKLFETDEEKLLALIKTYLSNGEENSWHRIVLEVSLFKPYFKLEIVEEETEEKKKAKKEKELKYLDDDYVLEVLSKKHCLIEQKDYKGLMKNYKKHYDDLDGKINPVVGAVGAVAVTAATGGAAFMFAPAIATALVGGSFVGLYGAALTNASLALIGGGSLAVGGFGMAGGTAIIAGGGALIGLGTSGVTAAALSLMTSSEYAKVDYAKLLTNCDYIMIGKYGKIKEVECIARQVSETAEDYRTRYALLEEKLPTDKKNKKETQAILKELNKSIDITDDSAKILNKLVEKAKKRIEK